MGVADHVLESISGHLSRRMLEHYSHIRIDAKRQALDALGQPAAWRRRRKRQRKAAQRRQITYSFPMGARVTWRNNGTMVHSAHALDDSWSTGPIDPTTRMGLESGV
jgi:hypothetical protein